MAIIEAKIGQNGIRSKYATLFALSGLESNYDFYRLQSYKRFFLLRVTSKYVYRACKKNKTYCALLFVLEFKTSFSVSNSISKIYLLFVCVLRI